MKRISERCIFLVLKPYHPMYTNPVVNSNHPDPGVLALPENQGFVLVSTSDLVRPHSAEPVFPILHSLDMVHWKLVSFQNLTIYSRFEFP